MAITEFRPETYLIRYTSGIYSNTKFSLGTGFEVLEFRKRVLIYLAQDREEWQGASEDGNETLGYKKVGISLTFAILKKDSGVGSKFGTM